LTRDDIRALAPEVFPRNADVDGAAEHLARFLITDARSHSHVFEHPRFGDFVREEVFGEDECAEFERRFVDYGSRVVAQLDQGQREESPVYVVRWHATHLLDSRRPLDDFRPLLTFRWYQESERVYGTPAGFLADLDKAWEAAASTGVGMRVRIALLRSSLLTLGRSIPVELFERCVQAGVFSPTLAEVIARQQQELKSEFVARLADCLPGERNRLLREALEAARQIGAEGRRAAALSAVASRLDPAGLQRLAADVRSLIDQPGSLGCLRAIAEHWPDYIRAGNRTPDDELAYWLDPLSRENRSHLLGAITALIPAIDHAGGQQAIVETAVAIRDAVRWWP
jgi:hypothetical protein